jgi:hypothetical protein
VILVSCVSKKNAERMTARDLYVSQWFLKARQYAESQGEWGILSARYGLVLPDEEIDPYGMTLNKMNRNDRVEWANLVAKQIANCTRDDLTVFAGRRYREHLIPLLESQGYAVAIPLEGMGIGKQLQWFDKENKR